MNEPTFIQKALKAIDDKDTDAYTALWGTPGRHNPASAKKAIEYLNRLRCLQYITIDKQKDLILLTEKGKELLNEKL